MRTFASLDSSGNLRIIVNVFYLLNDHCRSMAKRPMANLLPF